MSGELIYKDQCVSECPGDFYESEGVCVEVCEGARQYHLGRKCVLGCPEFVV